jgi:transcriptional regulator with XRE-family HTH domain
MPRGHVLPDGATVAALRGEAGLTQDELADRSGYGLRTIGNVEGGRPTTATTLAALAAVLSSRLGRPVAMSDLLAQHRHAARTAKRPAGGLTFADNVKLLELQDSATSGRGKARATRPPGAVLFDTFVVRDFPKSPVDVMFYYVGSGAGVEGSSLSHPREADWLSPSEARARGGDVAPRDRHRVLRLTLTAARPEAQPVMQNRLELLDGFARSDEGALHAHVAYPTDCLTMLVKFPGGQAPRTLRGMWRRRASSPFVPAGEMPLGIAEAHLAYWRITAPQPGETYQLSWA